MTVRRITFIGNEHVSDAELRDTMQTGNGGFFSFGSGGPYRQDVFERDVLMLSALYYDKGYLSVQIGTPRVMLTPDREGIDIARRHPRGAALQDPPASHLRARQRGQGGRAPRRPARAAPDDPRAVGRLLQPRGAHQGPRRRSARSTATRATPTSRPSPRRELDPVHEQVDIVVPIRRGPPVHIERIEVKGNTKTRDKVIRREMEIQEGQLFSETGLEQQQAAHHGARLLRARRRLDRAGVGARQDHHQLRGDREADGHLPGRRGLQLDRELHRDGAGAAGEPLRQRAVARPAGAGLGAAAARHAALLRAVLPRLATGTSSSSSTTRSTSSRTSRAGASAGRSPSATRSSSPWLRLSAHRHRSSGTRSTPRRRRHVLRRDARLRQRLPAACRSRTSSTPGASSRSGRPSPTTRATTASSRRRASSSRRRPSSRPSILGSQFNYLRNQLHGPLLLPARRRQRACPARASSSS